MKVRYNMVVDFARPSKSNTVIIAENDANSRVLHFTLLNDKEAFDMENVTNAILRGIAPSGRQILDGDVEILRDEAGNMLNEVEYLIPQPLTETAGTLTTTITLYGASGEAITSFEMYIKIRNALYNEDDSATEEDITGFRELLERTETALAKVENMILQNALQNPEPLVVQLDGMEIVYYGDELKDLPLGTLARIGGSMGEIEETIDDSSAQMAMDAADRAQASENKSKEYADMLGEAGIEGALTEARGYAQSAGDSAALAQLYSDNIERIVPTVDVHRNEDDNGAEIKITDVNGDHTTFVMDGKSITASSARVNDYVVVTLSDRDTGEILSTFTLKDGINGDSITARSSKAGKVTTVEFLDKNTLEVLDRFTIQDGQDGTGGGGDMRQSVYDPDGSGIVDYAEALSKGTITITAEEIKNKLDEHEKINKPSIDGTDGQVLKTDGQGNTYWGEAASSNYIEETSEEFAVTNKKLSLAQTIKDAISSIAGKINKPVGIEAGKVPTADGEGGVIWKEVEGGGGISEDDIVKTVEGITQAEDNNKVPSAFAVSEYSNVYTECIGAILTSGSNTIGKWFEKGETWDVSQMLQDSRLIEQNGEQLHFEFAFWIGEEVTSKNLKENASPLHIAGYQWDSTAGALTIKCAETAPNNTTVIVKITHVREKV